MPRALNIGVSFQKARTRSPSAHEVRQGAADGRPVPTEWNAVENRWMKCRCRDMWVSPTL